MISNESFIIDHSSSHNRNNDIMYIAIMFKVQEKAVTMLMEGYSVIRTTSYQVTPAPGSVRPAVV